MKKRTYPRFVYQNGSKEPSEYSIWRDYEIGDILIASYAAPGVGTQTSKCIAKNDSSITFQIISDTGRILEPYEVI